jgi:hypothetical protein
MKTMIKVITLMLMSMLLVVACGNMAVEPEVPPTPEPSPLPGDPDETTAPVPPEDEMDARIPDELQELAERMMADLSDRAEVSREAISVVEVETVTWSDGSLGCPQPDMGYTMALEPGYRVILGVDGKEFHYHTRGTVDFVYCENPPENNGTVPSEEM